MLISALSPSLLPLLLLLTTSLACGPLVKWITAQMQYSEILDRVQPLRDEVAALEGALAELNSKQAGLNKTIDDLEKAIGRYKDEYAVLIGEATQIKTELSRVKEKVERSIALLQRLSGESGRWHSQVRIIINSPILYYTILYYTILYYTILYYTILYYTILYYTILYLLLLSLSNSSSSSSSSS